MTTISNEHSWVVYPKGIKVVCFFCHGEAYSKEYDKRGTVAQGVAYYEAKPNDYVPICIPCWKEKMEI